MSTLTNYKQLQVVTPDPTGNGGLALNDNFMTLADSIGPCNYTATTDPSTSNNQSTGYYAGSRWFNTTSNNEFVCISSTMSTAVWEKTTGGNTTPTLQQVTNAGNTTTDDVTLANVALSMGNTLSVDNISDAGSGLVTIASTTTLAGTSWSIDTSGNGTFAKVVSNQITDAGVGTVLINSITIGSSLSSWGLEASPIGGTLSGMWYCYSLTSPYATWAIDDSGNADFSSVYAGNGNFYSVSIGSGNATIDGSGNGTFANLVIGGNSLGGSSIPYIAFTDSSNVFGALQTFSGGLGNGLFTIDASGDATFSGSLSIASGSATIDSSGNGTFTNLISNELTDAGSGSITLNTNLTFGSGFISTLPAIDSTVAGSVAGQVGYDPSTNKAYVWDGTAWNALW